VFELGSPERQQAIGSPGEDVESWRTPKRTQLVAWLEENAPALLPLYNGAFLLATSDSFPGRVHFIAHAIREIQNRLPSALGPNFKQQRAGYEDLTDKICEQWSEEGLPQDGTLPPPDQSEPSASGPRRRDVSIGLLTSVGQLIKKHNEAQANRKERERSGFSNLGDLGPNPQYVLSNWRKRFPKVEKFAHAWDKPLPVEADGEWVENFFEFEQYLMALSKPSYENLDDLDSLLAKANKR